MAIDLERARFNMIEQQVRPWDVLDPRVLETLAAIKREDFVPPRYRKMAFADLSLPIDEGEVMMKPVVEGRVLQALEIQPGDSVLEIGTGTGFLTACLARLGREVTSVELRARFVERARSRIEAAGLTNVTCIVADAVRDYEPKREFDAICVTGAVFEIPERFRRWLAPGGRLFAIRGESPAMEAVLVTRLAAGGFALDSLFETDLPYLVNAAPPRRFAL
jgi:protein-L-isoaspartate(D-aspartate) O-methyltransferase